MFDHILDDILDDLALPEWQRATAAAGVPGLVTAADVKPGAVVIDVGVNRVRDAEGRARTVGDVAFEEVAEVAGWISPVPGGVGPMTITMLLYNTLESAKRKAGK